MGVYAEIDRERAERQARRAARLEKQQRVERILRPVKTTLEFALWLAIAYLYLYVGALWASL